MGDIYGEPDLKENIFQGQWARLAMKQGVYGAWGVEAPMQYSWRSTDLGGGLFEAFPVVKNMVYVGHLQYLNSGGTAGQEGWLTVTTNNTNRVVDTVRDSKMVIFDGIIADNTGPSTMNAPVVFQGWAFMVTGRGSLP